MKIKRTVASKAAAAGPRSKLSKAAREAGTAARSAGGVGPHGQTSDAWANERPADASGLLADTLADALLAADAGARTPPPGRAPAGGLLAPTALAQLGTGNLPRGERPPLPHGGAQATSALATSIVEMGQKMGQAPGSLATGDKLAALRKNGRPARATRLAAQAFVDDEDVARGARGQ